MYISAFAVRVLSASLGTLSPPGTLPASCVLFKGHIQQSPVVFSSLVILFGRGCRLFGSQMDKKSKPLVLMFWNFVPLLFSAHLVKSRQIGSAIIIPRGEVSVFFPGQFSCFFLGYPGAFLPA